MLTKILGFKGNCVLDYSINYLKQSFKDTPIHIFYFYPIHYPYIQQVVSQYELEANVVNFYAMFAPYLGLNYYSKDLPKLFLERIDQFPDIKLSTVLFVIPYTHLDKKIIEKVREIKADNMILCGDPVASPFLLTDFQGEVVDINNSYSFPEKIFNFLKRYIEKYSNYRPNWKPLDVKGEVLNVKYKKIFDYFDKRTLIVTRNSHIKHDFFKQNISYSEINLKRFLSIPVDLFNYYRILEAISSSKRLINIKEILKLIKVTKAEITEKFGGRKNLIDLYSCVKNHKPHALMRSPYISYLVEVFRKNKIETLIKPREIEIYQRWKDKIKDKKWISPNIFFIEPQNLSFEEFDTVMVDLDVTKHEIWKAMARAKERVIFFET